MLSIPIGSSMYVLGWRIVPRGRVSTPYHLLLPTHRVGKLTWFRAMLQQSNIDVLWGVSVNRIDTPTDLPHFYRYTVIGAYVSSHIPEEKHNSKPNASWSCYRRPQCIQKYSAVQRIVVYNIDPVLFSRWQRRILPWYCRNSSPECSCSGRYHAGLEGFRTGALHTDFPDLNGRPEKHLDFFFPLRKSRQG